MPQAKRKATRHAKPTAVKPQVQRSSTTAQTEDAKTPEEEQAEREQALANETDEDRAAVGNARAAKVSEAGQKGKAPDQVYEPERQELEHADFDHHGAEEKRQAELQAERDEHNQRTGDASRA